MRAIRPPQKNWGGRRYDSGSTFVRSPPTSCWGLTSKLVTLLIAIAGIEFRNARGMRVLFLFVSLRNLCCIKTEVNRTPITRIGTDFFRDVYIAGDFLKSPIKQKIYLTAGTDPQSLSR